LELWEHLGLATLAFRDLGLPTDSSDWVVWQRCQQEQLVLVTGNRNHEGPESLESAIRPLNAPHHLPVLTLANMDRILHERSYAERVADKLLEDLFDVENFRGAGRVYVP
jgi:hypothetical protein